MTRLKSVASVALLWRQAGILIGPKLLDKQDEIQQVLVEMNANEKGQGVLSSLGFNGWEKIEDDEMEFMIDLMDTLII